MHILPISFRDATWSGEIGRDKESVRRPFRHSSWSLMIGWIQELRCVTTTVVSSKTLNAVKLERRRRGYERLYCSVLFGAGDETPLYAWRRLHIYPTNTRHVKIFYKLRNPREGLLVLFMALLNLLRRDRPHRTSSKQGAQHFWSGIPSPGFSYLSPIPVMPEMPRAIRAVI